MLWSALLKCFSMSMLLVDSSAGSSGTSGGVDGVDGVDGGVAGEVGFNTHWDETMW